MSKGSSSQVITCKAAVCWRPGEPVKLEVIQVDPPKASEIRVKMLYASLCHTDILCSKGFPAPLFPRVLGHEGVGEVESIGDEVKGIKEGDRVIPVYIGECKECDNCTSGKTNLCLKYPLNLSGLLPDGTSRMSTKGERLYHLLSCSTWSEYAVMDSNYVVKVDPSLDLAHASFLSCGFSTGFGSAWKEAKVDQGSTVAVIGMGAVGLGAIKGARIQGAARIIGVDKNQTREKKGYPFGMTHFINPKEVNEKSTDVSELIKDKNGGLGVDYCFECTGVAELVNQALLATKPGKGMAIVVGASNDPTLKISSLPLLLGGTVKGTVFGGLKTKSDLPTILLKAKNKELHLSELMTQEEIKLDEIDKVYQMLKEPDCLKIVIKIAI